jgi:cyclic pyranopterin phosphate synthase
MHKNQNPSSHPLIDRFGRQVNYVRISVTDRCDLRCTYCMPRNMKFLPRAQILSLEEIEIIASSMIRLGVDKIRITGGEPLLRRNILSLFQKLGDNPGLKDLTLTTNGTQLGRYAQALKAAGVTRINVSLDTLKNSRFKRMTRVGKLANTLAGIDRALDCDFNKIKINSVILRHYNHDEVHDLTRFAVDRGLDISFIEEMPLGINTAHDRAAVYYSSDQIMDDLKQQYELIPCTHKTGGPSRYYRLVGQEHTRVGFISPHSHNFCDSCNRVRLTAEGRLLLCLGQEHSVDLRHVIRTNPGDCELLEKEIISAMKIKPQGHEFNHQHTVLLRHMNMTGG